MARRKPYPSADAPAGEAAVDPATGAPLKSAPSSRRTQMTDIARLAGVSIASVSRALNGSPEVSEATRARIVELARSLNYAVNASARSLRQGHTNTVAVLAPLMAEGGQALTDPFLWELIGGIAEALTARGYRMLLSRVPTDSLAVAEAVESGVAMGLILTGQWLAHDHLNELVLQGIPLAVWGAERERQLYCTVGTDNRLGGELATGHLLARGARHIAYVGNVSTPELGQRHQGYVQAHTAAGLSPNPQLHISETFNVAVIEESMRLLLASGLPLDGVVASSDAAALTILRVLQSAGRRVPQDVALVGYDDIPVSGWVSPALTTVRQPWRDAGRALVQALDAQLAGHAAPPVVLPTALVVRESA